MRIKCQCARGRSGQRFSQRAEIRNDHELTRDPGGRDREKQQPRQLARDKGAPHIPPEIETWSAAPIAAATAIAAKAKRQPAWSAMNVTSGSPMAMASDQPRNTKEIAPARRFSEAIKAIVLAAYGV